MYCNSPESVDIFRCSWYIMHPAPASSAPIFWCSGTIERKSFPLNGWKVSVFDKKYQFPDIKMKHSLQLNTIAASAAHSQRIIVAAATRLLPTPIASCRRTIDTRCKCKFWMKISSLLFYFKLCKSTDSFLIPIHAPTLNMDACFYCCRNKGNKQIDLSWLNPLFRCICCVVSAVK